MSNDLPNRIRGTEGYAESADALADQYESISFADVHRDILHLIPQASSRVLDIGAGTGRDAAALADLGHSVVAVEPTAELRAHGRRLHPSARIDWVDDSLPGLDALYARGERFDLIMLTAVWMHLDEELRARAMGRISGLVRSGGAVVLSLRHGPVPAGRRMFDVSAEETCTLARKSGLDLVHQSQREDMLDRPGVRWSFLVFCKNA